MIDYTLLVQRYDGEPWREVVLRDYPALNFVSNDLADISAKQASYSQNINIPRCPENDVIFEFAAVPDAYTGIPYKSMDCRLYSGAATLAGKGAKLVLNAISDVYECQILYGNLTFYDKLSSMRFADYDFLSVPITRTACEGISATQYTYGIAEFTTNNEGYNMDMYLGKCKPFIPMSFVLARIMSYAGYSLQHSVPLATYNNIYTSLATLNTTGTVDPANYKATGTAFIPFGAQGYTEIQASTNVITSGNNSLIANYSSSAGYNTSLSYYLPFNSSVTVKVKTGRPSGGLNRNATDGYIVLISNGVNVQQFKTYNGYEYEQEFTLNLSADPNKTLGNYIVFSQDTWVDENGQPQNGGMTTEITFTPTGDVNPSGNAEGQTAAININLGFETFYDYFKMFMQTFALMVDVNEDSKLVRAHGIDRIITKELLAGQRLDWSKNVILNSSSRRTFRADSYAQNNIITFEENGIYKVKDSASFNVFDDSLETEKTVLEIATESGADVYRDMMPSVGRVPVKMFMAEIPMYERVVDDSGTPTINYNDTKKPHLVFKNTTTYSFSYKSTYYNATFTARNYPVFTHFSANNVAAQYASLATKVLTRYMEVEEELLLTVDDINTLDLLQPVYLEKYGRFFYINKVSNFIVGKKTKVTLISL